MHTVFGAKNFTFSQGGLKISSGESAAERILVLRILTSWPRNPDPKLKRGDG